MTVVRPLIVSGVFCIVAAASLSGCAHHSGSPFTPTTSSFARSDANVIYHQTRTVPDSSERSIGKTTTTIYAGAVATVPAIVSNPMDVAYNPDDGNFYVLEQGQDYYHGAIVRVTSSGATLAFTTFAGHAYNIVYDHANRTFYVTAGQVPTSYDPAVYAINSTGTATLLAGGTAYGHTDGTGSAASFTYASGITLDATDGALYIVDNDRIRRMTTAGVVTTLTPPNSIGNNYSSRAAGIVWNKFDGNFYVADSSADVIRKVTHAGVVSTVAGFCSTGFFGAPCAQLQRDGVAANALFATPSGITAVPSTGVLYVADQYNNSIREVLPNGTVTTLAGNGVQGDVNGAGQNAEFNVPVSLTYGANELLVIENNTSTNTSAVRSVTTSGATPPPLQTNISLFDTKTPAAQPFALDWHATTPSSTTLWYTEAGGKIASLTTLGVSTEYSIAGTSAQFADIILGSDGSQWVYDQTDAKMIHRASNGSIAKATLPVSSYGSLPQYPDTAAIAPDASIWVVQSYGNNGLSHVTPQGVVTSFNNSLWVRDIVVAGDGSVWLSDGNTTIERLNQNGNVTKTYNYSAQFLTRGSDGNIWFSQPDAIGKINTTNNAIEVFPLYEPIPGCPYYGCSRGVGAVTPGPDGAYWFVETNTGSIGRIDTTGGFTEYKIYAAHAHPNDIVTGPDGNLWFVDGGGQKVGRVKLH